MAVIGKRNNLVVVSRAERGLYLEGGSYGEILLPARYAPRGVEPGDMLEVFLYLDSEDRLIATTEMPLAEVGEFAEMKVVSVNPRVGAFLDWGLSKDLLLPFREQKDPVRIGERVIAYVDMDRETQRIVASTRLNRHLDLKPPFYRPNQEVDLLITAETPLGYNAIVDHAHRGLLYHDRAATPVRVGQKLKGFVRAVRDDGKIDLTLDSAGYKRVAPLTQQILTALEKNGGRLPFNDDSPPEAIREKFGVSKKAFKQALGALYKKRHIRFSETGIEQIDPMTWSPGES